MLRAHLYRRIVAWVALLTLVWGALVPTLTQAMVTGTGGDRLHWLQVCSTSGMVWVRADTGERSNQSPRSEHPMGDVKQHCPWCTLHTGAAGLPPTAYSVALSPQPTDLPPAFDRRPPVAAVWAPAQSRAPPLIA